MISFWSPGSYESSLHHAYHHPHAHDQPTTHTPTATCSLFLKRPKLASMATRLHESRPVSHMRVREYTQHMHTQFHHAFPHKTTQTYPSTTHTDPRLQALPDTLATQNPMQTYSQTSTLTHATYRNQAIANTPSKTVLKP